MLTINFFLNGNMNIFQQFMETSNTDKILTLTYWQYIETFQFMDNMNTNLQNFRPNKIILLAQLNNWCERSACARTVSVRG